jgi:hypothetical protein
MQPLRGPEQHGVRAADTRHAAVRKIIEPKRHEEHGAFTRINLVFIRNKKKILRETSVLSVSPW